LNPAQVMALERLSLGRLTMSCERLTMSGAMLLCLPPAQPVVALPPASAPGP
jgi:hypothetical protein